MKALNCSQPKIIKEIGRCYREYTCKTCGIKFEVDSGD
jgi:transposase-like protein